MDMPLARKQTFLNKWNDDVTKKHEALWFLKLDNEYSKDELIRLFSTYFINNNSFYISDIFDDEFNLYHKNETELNNLDTIIETYFLKVVYWSRTKNIPLKSIFKTKKLSPIFKFYDKKQISVNTLLGFNKAFNLIKRVDEEKLNFVEREKYSQYKLIFTKYDKIVYKYFNFDVKDFLKKVYERI